MRIKIRCKDYTKIPAERLFGVGDKLYRIKVTVEPPVEDFENDDLLEEELDKGNGQGNATQHAAGGGRKEKGSTDTDQPSSSSGGGKGGPNPPLNRLLWILSCKFKS